MQRRESFDHFSAIINGVEMLTGKPFPEKLREQALTGSTQELTLVRSGLEDTMREAYKHISHEWNTNPDVKDGRVAAMKIAVERVVKSYGSLEGYKPDELEAGQ